MRSPCGWLLALGMLAGCASAESDPAWTRAGATDEQTKRDRTECLTQARQVTPGVDGPRMKLDYPRYERCMGDRGYTMAPRK